MYVLIGALVGGLVMAVLSVMPLVSSCNCFCCMWYIVGGLIAAFITAKLSPAGCGAGKGAITGLLAGLVGATGICAVYMLMAGLQPDVWDIARSQALTDDKLGEIFREVKDPAVKADLIGLGKRLRSHEKLEDAFTEFKTWLSDERIEAFGKVMAAKGPGTAEHKRQVAQFISFLKDIKTLDSKAAMAKLDNIKFMFKLGMFGTIFFLAAMMSFFGGLISGAMFGSKDEPTPEAAPAA